eukprot:13464293-Alexandrium_andersonii.AAC.1
MVEFASRLNAEAMCLETLSYSPPQLLHDVLDMPLGKAIKLLVAVSEHRAAALVPPPAEAAQLREALRGVGPVAGGSAAASPKVEAGPPTAAKSGSADGACGSGRYNLFWPPAGIAQQWSPVPPKPAQPGVRPGPAVGAGGAAAVGSAFAGEASANFGALGAAAAGSGSAAAAGHPGLASAPS